MVRNRFSLEACKARSVDAEHKLHRIQQSAALQKQKTRARQDRDEWLENFRACAREQRELETSLRELVAAHGDDDSLLRLCCPGDKDGNEPNPTEHVVAGEENKQEILMPSTITEEQLWRDVTLLRSSLRKRVVDAEQRQSDVVAEGQETQGPGQQDGDAGGAAGASLPTLLEFCLDLQRANGLALRACDSNAERLLSETRAARTLARGLGCTAAERAEQALDLSEDEEEFLESWAGATSTDVTTPAPDVSERERADDGAEHADVGCDKAPTADASAVPRPSPREVMRRQAAAFENYVRRADALQSEYVAECEAKRRELEQVACELALLAPTKEADVVPQWGRDRPASALAVAPQESAGAPQRSKAVAAPRPRSLTSSAAGGGGPASVRVQEVQEIRLVERRRFLREQLGLAYRKWRKKRKELLELAKAEKAKQESEEEERFEKDVDLLKRDVQKLKTRQAVLLGKESSNSRRIEVLRARQQPLDQTEKRQLEAQLEKALAAKLQDVEKRQEVSEKRKEQRQLQREAERTRADVEEREFAVLHHANSERKRLRDQKERLKCDEKKRRQEESAEKEERKAQRFAALLHKLQPEIAYDASKLLRDPRDWLCNGVKYFDPKGTICRNQVADVHGYFEQRLLKDPRYKLSAALQGTGVSGGGGAAALYKSDAARSAMNSLQPSLPANHALSSAIPGLPLQR
mmetsp:Transcript_2978/g.6833  ORF Transcript_2978/g.6833 Transcript_2978/m.6833 type:complete len:697 (+) Transcript_2978:117-2207(+)|eukprot:CAMPEP_0178997876 /NCGR_PEP_ID=MMETSP0795-20121207/9200_1 /TAXON_ID=88552 /ORGANISM="Amoebophrya sp., Strain Ameob2" /LENGTH=696 /DNA_ID=CAMNT_0020690491 /DNA_START=55 /DNA_END=2145 /DNA_ORIENTATION=-